MTVPTGTLVASVDAPFAHGDSYVLTAAAVTAANGWVDGASSFGTKATAEPYRWDDFQAYSNGQSLDALGLWVTGSGSSPDAVASTENLRAGTPFVRNMCADLVTGSCDIQIWPHNTLGAKYYWDYWFNHEFLGAGYTDSGNIKPWFFFTNWDADQYEYGLTWVGAGGDTNLWRSTFATANCDPPVNPQTTFYNQFAHFQVVYECSASGAGTYVVYVNGTRRINLTNISTVHGNESLDMWDIGCYAQMPVSGTRHFFDSMYFDNSWARVELGDNATYLSCTHREIQVPSAWSTSSITLTCNRGSFAVDDTAYLHVINSSNVPAASIPVTVGAD